MKAEQIVRIMQLICLLLILASLYFQSDILLIAAAVVTAIGLVLGFSNGKKQR